MRSTLTFDVGKLAAADPARDVVLSSPDVRLLKLPSPDLERLVIQLYSNNHYQHQQQQQEWCEQESSKDGEMAVDVMATQHYARGFVDALLELQSQRQTDCNSTTAEPSASAAMFQIPTTGSSAVSWAPHQADVCQAVSSWPGSSSGSGHVTSFDTAPMSPVGPAQRQTDDDGDERTRLDRKRARNRQAATRCRNRKLQRIDELQSHADRLRAINAKLTDEVKQLRQIVNKLQQDLLLHAGCQPGLAMPSVASLFDNSI